MPRETPSLCELQRWMLQVVSHPGAIDDSLRDPIAAGLIPDAETWVQGPGPLDGKGGVGIYHRMYKLRLREALEIDYPALQWALGGSRFFGLADAYIAAYPSSSWTLNRLGDHWPTHLAKTEDPWIADLARLELAQTMAIQSPGGDPLSPQALGAIPPEAFESAIMVASPSLRLVEAEHDVVELYERYREELPFAVPVRSPSRIAVYRGERTEQFKLSGRPWAFLGALVRGEPLGGAIEIAYPEADEAAALEIQTCLADWVGRGLFSAIRA